MTAPGSDNEILKVTKTTGVLAGGSTGKEEQKPQRELGFLNSKRT